MQIGFFLYLNFFNIMTIKIMRGNIIGDCFRARATLCLKLRKEKSGPCMTRLYSKISPLRMMLSATWAVGRPPCTHNRTSICDNQLVVSRDQGVLLQLMMLNVIHSMN